MSKCPLISVIIPVLNGEAYLREAIESIQNQIYSNIEIIVVDDGSNDGTAQLVKRQFTEVRYFYQDNAGIGSARNHGIKRARGGYIAFLDADDTFLPEKLDLQMQVLSNRPEVDMVFGHIRQFLSSELSEQECQRIRCSNELMPAELPSTMLCRCSVFDRVGPFETCWKVGQDVSWVMRAREQNMKSVMLPDLVYLRRLHRNNNGNTQSEHLGDRVRILKAMLDRRRAMAAARK